MAIKFGSYQKTITEVMRFKNSMFRITQSLIIHKP
jgi:hypothetical protein